jgi:hypothetical protein
MMVGQVVTGTFDKDIVSGTAIGRGSCDPKPIMKIATMVIQNAVRVLGLILLVLGFMFWSGRNFDLIPVHMRLGEILVSLLWIISAMGLRAGVKPGMVLGAMFYGLIVVAFAMRMGGFLPGGAHEVIRIVHLLFGLGAMGLVEMIGAKIKRGIAK